MKPHVIRLRQSVPATVDIFLGITMTLLTWPGCLVAAEVVFGSSELISDTVQYPLSVRAADMDGGGDADVLFATSENNQIAWHENRLDEATQDFAPERIITTIAKDPNNVVAADLDGDGDLDAVASSTFGHMIAWHENRLNEPAADFAPGIDIETDAGRPRSIFAADIDSDGDMDVLGASGLFAPTTVAWYENRLEGGAASFSPARLINASFDVPLTVLAVDLNGDARLDVLASSGLADMLVWHRSLGPSKIKHAWRLYD